MDGIVKFQTIVKDRLKIRDNINTELKWLIQICQDIISRLDQTLAVNIISKNIYAEVSGKLTDCLNIINKIAFLIPLTKLTKIGSFSYAIKISKIKFQLIHIIQEVGCCQLENISKLILDISLKQFNYSVENQEILNILNEYFNPITCEVYTLQTDNQYSLNIQNQNEGQTKLKLADNQQNKLTLLRLTPFTKGILLRLNGCKIYLPYQDKLLVINGFFKKTNQISYFYFQTSKNKFHEIKTSLSQTGLAETFQVGYLAQINFRDLLLSSCKEIVDICQQKYQDLKKLRNKSISQIIKDFVNLEQDNQQEIISNLLLDQTNIENIYICYVLFDLLHQEQNINGIKVSDQIFESLSWQQQQILNSGKTKADMLTNDLIKHSEETIPYEKRILLMKCDKKIKTKALEKLKEINSSKGGESSSKAQQYIEGLLKIPFGIYRYEPIINYLSGFIHNLKEVFKKQPDVLNHLENINSQNYSTNEINLRLNNCHQQLISDSNKALPGVLTSLTCQSLKEILQIINQSKNGNKTKLVNKIMEHESSLSLETRLSYKLFSDQIMKHQGYLEEYITLTNKWNGYLSDRKQYLKNVDQILNSSVYGMEDAKQEMKRIIAQWINGSSEGYILGFEGPPGTGKTTLAKKGISQCLRDENGLNRPFTFIALGGSTNGSTLEGHNYTYVGSTWGRIVEALMETQCMNPIIYIDELDKISRTEHGKELIGILIHLTDPSQNEEFMDKYFSGVKIDISRCLIIFSYNDVTKIDRVLLDRIHRIKIDPLTRYDKYIVAHDHMIPEICKAVGFNPDEIVIDQETLFYIIDNYTFEAGARKLKENLFDIIREINLKYLMGEQDQFPQLVTKDMVQEIFYKKHKVILKKIPDNPSIGLVNGLYATSTGTGGITTIEAFRNLTDTRLNLELTGQQGDVMKESMRVAKTIAWNLLPPLIKDRIRTEKPFGIHIHCPEAAQPKDGPSAGTAITIAMLSLLSNIPVNNEIAITGEIDLNGNVLAIGGLEYKIEGAKSAGVKLVLCPQENGDDLEKIINGKNNPTGDGDFQVKTIKNIYEAIDYMLIGHKCSSVFKLYQNCQNKVGSDNDYLATFKSLSEANHQLICLVDTTPDFLITYVSKGFGYQFNLTLSEIIGKPITELFDKSSQVNFRKILENTQVGYSELSCQLQLVNNMDNIITFICHTKKIDNIITCTMRVLNS